MSLVQFPSLELARFSRVLVMVLYLGLVGSAGHGSAPILHHKIKHS